MDDSQVTRPSLLLRIRNADDVTAWREFAEVYGPLVHRFGRKRGLQDADAADLAQDVLSTVAGTIENLNYNRQIGRFRGWLLTVARSKLSNLFTRRKRQPQGSGDSAMRQSLENIPSTADEEAEWDSEYERRLFEWAAERIRPDFQDATWQAFWSTAVDGLDARTVSDRLGMTVGAVYIAKSRVLARLKDRIKEIGER